MSITFLLTYTGKAGAAQAFVQEMESSGITAVIRSREGNLRYDYYVSHADSNTVLLVDSWASQEALDIHHASPEMEKIVALREKYDLRMTAERLVSDDDNFSAHDRSFIRD
ncbi:putative quinol monooxygenase [Streptococcus caprae]|uniref:Quinol monooxygenase n=1 Tax=Streptococcus caprae TaxID=1640501 RepID=A0ABV8CYN5_9STRE